MGNRVRRWQRSAAIDTDPRSVERIDEAISAAAICGIRSPGGPWLRGNLSGKQRQDVAALGRGEMHESSRAARTSDGCVNCEKLGRGTADANPHLQTLRRGAT
jgi:hypothetical protein